MITETRFRDYVLDGAKNYSIPFDGKINLIDSVSMDGDTYYVASYSNPFGEGIEVLNSDGKKISNA